MKLHAVLENYESDIQITGEEERVFADLDGRRYELDVHQSGSDGYLIVSSGQVFDCRVEGRPESGKRIDVIVGTRNYAVTLTDPKRLSSATSASAHRRTTR